MQKSYKREKYFLNKKFQGSYALILFSSLIIMLFLSTLAIYMFIEGTILDKFSNIQTSAELNLAQRMSSLYNIRATGMSMKVYENAKNEAQLISANNIDKLENILIESRKKIIPILICIIFLISIFSIFISHKIAGPLFRLEKSIHEIRNRNLKSKIYLRKGDQLIYLAKAFNDMLNVINNDIKDAKKEIELCKEKKDIKENISKLEEIFSQYKISENNNKE